TESDSQTDVHTKACRVWRDVRNAITPPLESSRVTASRYNAYALTDAHIMPVLNHFYVSPIIVGTKAGLKSNAFYEWTDISNVRESQRKRKTDDLNDGSNEKRSRVEGRAKGQSPAVSSL
ncbi:unnamed protein product, partial [Medioppia subpectinata]